MKTNLNAHRSRICPPHLTYNAFSLAARGRTSGFLSLTPPAKNSICFCSVKQKRALLKSNPPRDNWTEGDEINRLHIWGAQNSPNANRQTFISEPSHALKNFEQTASFDRDRTEQINKNTLSSYPFFQSKPTLYSHNRRSTVRGRQSESRKKIFEPRITSDRFVLTGIGSGAVDSES